MDSGKINKVQILHLKISKYTFIPPSEKVSGILRIRNVLHLNII